jgi:hypothetical protein
MILINLNHYKILRLSSINPRNFECVWPKQYEATIGMKLGSQFMVI